VEVEIGPAVRDLGRVIEQNTGQERIDVPAVFPLEQERMEIAQAIDAQLRMECEPPSAGIR
jgi:hypothetical protein